MFTQFIKKYLQSSTRTFSTSSERNVKVAVLGAAGGIGQPLSLLLKCNTAISHLAIQDILNTSGIGADLSHINTPNEVVACNGPEGLDKILKGSNIVILAASSSRKPGLLRDELFDTNASIVRDLSEACAENCPKALIAIITNPVNSTVPIASEVFKQKGCYDPKRIFGVTTLDLVRSSTFLAEYVGNISPLDLNIPVIGGHSEITTVPVLSQANKQIEYKCQEDLHKLIDRIRQAGLEVIKAKSGTSSTLSVAFAAARFTNSLIKGLKGEKNVFECAYVASDEVCGVNYFATSLCLGKNGIENNLGIGKLNEYEKQLMEKALPDLKKDIAKGVEFINKKCK